MRFSEESPYNGDEPSRNLQPDIRFTHVQKPSIFPHNNIIMTKSKDQSGGTGVAGDGGNGRHRKGDKVGDEFPELGRH